MQPPGPRGLDCSVKAAPVDHFLCRTSNLDYTGEVCPRPRVEIYDRVVGVFEGLNSRMPRIDGNCAQLYGVEQGEQVVPDVARLCSFAGFNRLDSNA